MPKYVKTGGGPSKVDIPMAPMIDIVFQLLIFFMLNLKIVAPRRKFHTSTCRRRSLVASPDEPQVPTSKVRLQADLAATSLQLFLGDNRFGERRPCLRATHSEILKLIGRPGAANGERRRSRNRRRLRSALRIHHHWPSQNALAARLEGERPSAMSKR